jgi:hypothetical protein
LNARVKRSGLDQLRDFSSPNGLGALQNRPFAPEPRHESTLACGQDQQGSPGDHTEDDGNDGCLDAKIAAGQPRWTCERPVQKYERLCRMRLAYEIRPSLNANRCSAAKPSNQ